MKGSAAVSQVKVSADGQGVVSHAGVGMLRELADLAVSALFGPGVTEIFGPTRDTPGVA